MKKLRLLLIITYIFMMLFMVLKYVIADTDNDKAEKAFRYIETYKIIAVEEMHRIGVPASITLAQGLLESNYGQSRLARVGNNHFGIKCKSYWKGDTIRITDDAPNECFRKYRSVDESYIDHSNFLYDHPQDRYIHLFNLDRTDYKGWARGLKKAGYATASHYAESLISLIERYNLQQFDFMRPEDFYIVQNTRQSAQVINRPKPVVSQQSRIGGVVYGISDKTHSQPLNPSTPPSFHHSIPPSSNHNYPWTNPPSQETIVYHRGNANGGNRPKAVDVKSAATTTRAEVISESYPKPNYPWNNPNTSIVYSASRVVTHTSHDTSVPANVLASGSSYLAPSTSHNPPPIPQTPNPSIPQSPNPSIPQSPNPSIPQSPNPATSPTSTPYPSATPTPTEDVYTRTIPTPQSQSEKAKKATNTTTQSRFVFSIEQEEENVSPPPVEEELMPEEELVVAPPPSPNPSVPQSAPASVLADDQSPNLPTTENIGGTNVEEVKEAPLPQPKEELAEFEKQPPKRAPILIETVVNGCKAVVTDQPVHMNMVSNKYGVSLKKIRSYNDLRPNRQVPANTPIFLQKKKSKASKDNNEHIVERGETLELIAQKYGIRIKSLYKLNKQLYTGAQPVVGQTITLR